MQLEEYKSLITKMVTEPDSAQAIATDLINAITEDDGIRQGYESQITDLNTRISKLNETNSKLFMSVTGQTKQEEEEPEKTPKQIFGELFDERFYSKDKE